jgi:MarR family 2-MHQ and catechol resistance regulon transcriptional repressor
MNPRNVPEDRREAFYHHYVRQAGPQYAGFDLPSTQIALDLLYTYDLFHQLVARYMAPYGLSKSTLNVLMLLRHGDTNGMQLHDLGELLLVSKANITGLIDHLEKKGFVKRIVNTTDRRARYARITKKGEALLDQFMPVHYCHIKRFFEGLKTEEKRLLLNLLSKTRASLAAHSEPLPSEAAVCAGVQE